MNVIIKANEKELYDVLDSFEGCLILRDVSEEIRLMLRFVLEEILSNIINHAYDIEDENNIIKLKYIFEEDCSKLTVKFMDKGIPFDPLIINDPDTSSNSDEREVGGLGLFLVKKNVDNMSYEFKNNQNILTIEKILVE
jgi:anti-sigma regulatory factor (Ser/Thr protein kinase)